MWDISLCNWPLWYRALLHHVSLTCGRMQAYPAQIYTPTNWTQCYIALLHNVSLTCERMQMYSGQMYTPHSLNPVLQSCTTPCQSNMWQNADVPSSELFATIHMSTDWNAFMQLLWIIGDHMLSGMFRTYQKLSDESFSSLWTERTCIHLLLITPEAGDELRCSTKCP